MALRWEGGGGGEWGTGRTDTSSDKAEVFMGIPDVGAWVYSLKVAIHKQVTRVQLFQPRAILVIKVFNTIVLLCCIPEYTGPTRVTIAPSVQHWLWNPYEAWITTNSKTKWTHYKIAGWMMNERYTLHMLVELSPNTNKFPNMSMINKHNRELYV